MCSVVYNVAGTTIEINRRIPFCYPWLQRIPYSNIDWSVVNTNRSAQIPRVFIFKWLCKISINRCAAVEFDDKHISRNCITTWLFTLSCIRTVTGFIFCNSISLEPSTQIGNGCILIFKQLAALQCWCYSTIQHADGFCWCWVVLQGKLGNWKIFLIVGDSLSWNANGILEAAVTTAIFNSAAVFHNTSSKDWPAKVSLGWEFIAWAWSKWLCVLECLTTCCFPCAHIWFLSQMLHLNLEMKQN